MDNISYHGTKQEHASSIVGPPPNVIIDYGKGELGKGFYTGSSIALAASWAHSRFNKEACVIKIDIAEEEFVKLNSKVITTYEAVLTLWYNLKKQDERDKFQFNFDYVMAPFATVRELGNQYKFESKRAENLINRSKLNLFPCH